MKGPNPSNAVGSVDEDTAASVRPQKLLRANRTFA